jgi:Fic family protein
MSKPMTPPSLEELLPLLTNPEGDPNHAARIFSASEPAPEGRYRHWDTLKRIKPPSGLSQREWWLAIKLARRSLARDLPLRAPEGQPFTYGMPDPALELLHFIDQHASGEVLMPEAVLEDESAKRHYIVNSLIEEAIRSSQLEGATTSRVVAKEMLRTGRKPRNRSEQMIQNNYNALMFMRREVGTELTPDLVLELHKIVTEGTLDNPDAAGRLQQPGEDRVAVFDRMSQLIVHQPPAAELLPERFQLMCDFANERENPEGFMHPVVRAILLHLWMGYDHPFEDGNGRTARALFYWSMESQGYWVTEYLSISKILREAPAQYARAYLYTETDDFDTTYFILYQLAVIRRAIEDLRLYLRRKIKEVKEVESLMRASDSFNYRQLALLGDAVRHPTHRYAIASHARSHNVTHEAARRDLLDLARRGLLERTRIGRKYSFLPVGHLESKLGEIGGPSEM